MIQKGLLLVVLMMVDPGDIGKINTAKSEAKKAYLAGDYKTAIAKYTYLVDSIGVKEDEVMMNLANSYFHLNDTTNAISSFQPLTLSKNPRLQSVANQQLGVLHNRDGKFEEALSYFKQALKTNPANEDARFNYEMVKKKLNEQKKQEQQQQNKDKQNKDQEQKDQEQKDKEQKDKEQQNKDQQKKDQKSKEQEEQEKKEKEEQEKKDQQQKEQEEKEQKDKKEIPPSVKEKLKDMDMSEEKAKMILEAMKNQEIQYLQQNKRKATKQRDKTKPDW
jgi:Ca-activated chloride channel family protein